MAPVPRRNTAKTGINFETSDARIRVELPIPRREASSERGSLAQVCEGLIFRFLEIVIAISALILTFPVALWIGFRIRRDSPGPALFWQTRVGRNGLPFRFCKFRTLYVDARERWPELYKYAYTPAEIDRLYFKTEDDPRVTKIGRWLRRTTLDEIPNFLNLLKGDVALVGPRPEIPEMLQYYYPDELIKFSVKPGLTGLAQISGRNRITFRQTNEYDALYARTRTWKMDLHIAIETIRKIIARDGAL